MSTLCNEWLVPWLAQVQARTGMSDDFAGVTIMAFGGAVPELMISTISTLNNNNKVA
jgi:Ca2+/Na+ antiporter